MWAAPLAVLVAVWLWLCFSSGGYVPRTWFAGSLTLGLFGLVAASFIVYPARPRQLSLLVLVCFVSYAIWVACSAIWAVSASLAWLEAARTFTYLLSFALALAFMTNPTARAAFRYMLNAAALLLVLAAVVRLWTADDLASLFVENRFVFPISYSNGAAALYLILFWPSMWLAVDSRVKAPIRGLSLGIATALLGLGFLTQSRGALWSLAITVPIMFLLSPARLKTLFYLLAPALLMVWAVPQLNDYWRLGPEQMGGTTAGRALIVVLLTGGFIGVIIALLERWISVSRRMRLVFGVVALAVSASALGFGMTVVTRDVGGPIEWTKSTYHQFVGDANESAANDSQSNQVAISRLLTVSSTGRIDLWRVAWLDFKRQPWTGAGAASFIFTYDRLGERTTTSVSQPHSWELQILAETGLVGGIFGFAGAAILLGGLLWPRIAAGWHGLRTSEGRSRLADSQQDAPETERPSARWGSQPQEYGWTTALLVGVIYFMIHGSLEWLWQIAGVTLPMLLMVAAGLSEMDARVGAIWPRLSHWTSLGANKSAVRDHPADTATTANQLSASVAAVKLTEEGTFLHSERRRAKHYEARNRRRARAIVRRKRLRAALVPPGPLSHAFRITLGVASLVLLIWAGLPYLSSSIQDAALGSTTSDPNHALALTRYAAPLVPNDPEPYEVQAHIYQQAARAAALSTAADRVGALLDDLALVVSAEDTAIGNQPADWTLRYSAGVAALNLLLATDALSGRDLPSQEQLVAGVTDWSALTLEDPTSIPQPGAAHDSLANTPKNLAIAQHYRQLSRSEILELAAQYLAQARESYPISPQVAAAISFLEDLR